MGTLKSYVYSWVACSLFQVLFVLVSHFLPNHSQRVPWVRLNHLTRVKGFPFLDPAPDNLLRASYTNTGCSRCRSGQESVAFCLHFRLVLPFVFCCCSFLFDHSQHVHGDSCTLYQLHSKSPLIICFAKPLLYSFKSHGGRAGTDIFIPTL